MVQTRSQASVVGASSLWTGVKSNSAGPSRKQRTPRAAAPAPATAAPANSTSSAVATTKARPRKTTRKGGKSRGVAKAPRGRGRGTNRQAQATAQPAAAQPAAAQPAAAQPAAAAAAAAAAPPAPSTSAAAPTTADATKQTDGNCSTCDKLARRLGRRDDTIKDLKEKIKDSKEEIELLEDDRVKLHNSLMAETRCHEAANEEIKRLGGTQVDRSTPEDERPDKDWEMTTVE